MSSDSSTIAFLGDSTLDNIVWVPSVEECIASKTREKGHKVVNLAADGFNSQHMLHGGRPRISFTARSEGGDPFPKVVGSGLHQFHPLDSLEALLHRPTHTVLSVGGNDVREILGRMDLLNDRLCRFASNYPQIVSRVHRLCPRVMLCTQYRPHASHSGVYGVYQAIARIPGKGTAMQKMVALMRRVYQPVFQLARTMRLPVLDLTRSLDPHDGSLFCMQIEPSAKGGQIIADLISFAVAQHNFETDESTFYFYDEASKTIKSEPNTEDFTWDIDLELNDLHQLNPQN